MKKHVLTLAVLLSAYGLASAQTEKGTKMFGMGLSYDSQNNNSTRTYDRAYTKTSFPTVPSDTITMMNVHNENKQRNQTINLDISAGYFIAKNLLVGAQAGIGYAHNTDTRNSDGYYLKYNTSGVSNSINKNNITASSVGIFGRYYFPIKEGKLYAFGQLSGSCSFNNIKYTNNYTGNNLLLYYSDTIVFNNYSDVITQKYKTTNLHAQADAGIAYFVSPKFSIETSVLSARYTKQKPHNMEGYDGYISTTKPSQLEFWDYGAFLNMNLAVKYFFK